MSDFQFRTRGQQSPQGKQRVYFTCHPDDFEKYFEEIQKEFLDRQDCAVFYIDPEIQPEDVEDYELLLREMQLFVVPVTTKLLTKANRAMNVEVPFAYENNIPVLPLMQERGLDDVFNAKFGDLQYLNKYDTDPTTIPYEEKLTKYLESVIVGDELAKKIRAAFDAYIFLSYRKKDRKYAQELMNLIHSNPICRDIAIWYDEFLTPGENFNEAIRAAIEKSELFALAVTPNLVNEINYILTTEYPMARDMGKKILPAEMEQTDKDKLREMYNDIPELIANGDITTLANKLSKLFEAFAIRENENDPQHNFFIGLAYLNGIDVEINHVRAFELISGAAEAGYIPAMERLVSMYKYGEGVKRDIYKSVKCKEKLLDYYRNVYSEYPNENNFGLLLSNTRDLGKEYESIGQLTLAKQVFEDMICCGKLAVEKYSNIWFWHFLFQCYNDISQLTAGNFDLQEAEKWCNRAISEINDIDDNNIVMELSPDLLCSYICLGDVYRARWNLPEAIRCYTKSINLCSHLFPVSTAEEMSRLVANAYLKLGDCSRVEGDLKNSWQQINQALNIYNQCFLETRSNDYNSGIAGCYEQLGSIAESVGNNSLAEKYYKECYSIREDAYAKSESMNDLLDLCITCYNLGRVILKRDVKKGQRIYENGYALAKKLVVVSDTIKNRKQLGIMLDSMGDIERNSNPIKAQTYYLEACNIFERLFDETKSNGIGSDLALCYEKLFVVLKIQDLIEDALCFGQKCICILEKIAKATQRKEAYGDLARSFFNIGNAIKKKEYLEKAYTLWVKLYNAYPDMICYKKYAEIALESINYILNN